MVDTFGLDGLPLVGRQRELDRLRALVTAVRAGQSRALLVSGEAGIGKTALLNSLVHRVTGCLILQAAGVESEKEFPFATLHQLVGAHLDRLDRLPARQCQALRTAFRQRSGTAPDPSLVGSAVRTLLRLTAEAQPVICVIDDFQWTDAASAQALRCVASKLVCGPVGMVFATRDAEEAGLASLPEMVVHGLSRRDAGALLKSMVAGEVDHLVRNRLLAESHGNPLALIASSRGQAAVDLAFGDSGEHDVASVPPRLTEEFLRQVAALPEPSRLLLLIAAAEPTGDIALLRRAAAALGIGTEAETAAEAAGLVSLRHQVRFRHPLLRSAIYRSAGHAIRRKVHQVVAGVTDPVTDRDRRAWHLARAAVGPDETVAAELDRSAARALRRGGMGAAAAFLERAATLTPEPARRMLRFLNSADAKVDAGALQDALALLAAVDPGQLDQADRERVDLLRARILLAENRGDEALPALLESARRLEPLDPLLARDTYLDALSAAMFAGRSASGPGAKRVAEAVRAAVTPQTPRTTDVLLDGLSMLFTGGYERAAPTLHRAVRALGTDELTMDKALRSAWLASVTAAALWDDVGWDAITRRYLESARSLGAISALPLALHARTFASLFGGDFVTAASLVDETRCLGTTPARRLATYGEIGLLAVCGHPEQAVPVLRKFHADVEAQDECLGVNIAQWASAVLANGLGHYRQALAAARAAAAHSIEAGLPQWVLGELVEAGVRSGDKAAAAAALERLSSMTRAAGTNWALGVEASKRALLCDGAIADGLHREAIDRLGRTMVPFELARAQLVYGEWLRRSGRRVDARSQLRAAHATFAAMGAAAFAQRAEREMRATGETNRRRGVDTVGELTPQESHIARLAAEGLTNSEIGDTLYISPRTVEWHLRTIYTKLRVGTRRQLRNALPDAVRSQVLSGPRLAVGKVSERQIA